MANKKTRNPADTEKNINQPASKMENYKKILKIISRQRLII